jgi:hypothetical protein
MIGLLRFIGVANAAVWLGSVVFFTLSAKPAFTSPDMLYWFGSTQLGEAAQAYSGAAAQVVIHRFYTLQMICSLVALFHLVAEWLYSGKPLQRSTILLLAMLVGAALIGGYWLQPHLKTLHFARFNPENADEVRARAVRSFRVWNGVAFTLNLVSIAGLGAHLWRVTNPPNPDRYISVDRFRG